MPLRAARAFQSQPKRKAMEYRVSPRRTMYCPLVTGVRRAAAGAEPLRSTTLTPPGGDDEQAARREQVKVGQSIAEMGSTGTDRVKLHFEIRRQGKPVDPLQYLPRR